MKFDPSLPDDAVNVSDTHPLREALTLIVGVVVVGFVLFAAIALTVDLVVPHIPARYEARLFGGDWLLSLAGDENEEGEFDARRAGVAVLVERLSAHWPDNPYTFHVTIFDTSMPNAMAFPGGHVVVTTGLLDEVTSENELAFVLGHEIGHFRNRDHLRGLGRGLAFTLAMSVIGWSGASGATQLAALSGDLAGREFSRDQESDADRFGLDLLHQEYGHVAGASDFFDRTPDPEDSAAATISHYFSTHPMNVERTEALRDVAAERGWDDDGALAPLAVD